MGESAQLYYFMFRTLHIWSPKNAEHAPRAYKSADLGLDL